MYIKKAMKTNITLSGLLGILATLIIPLILWGVSIETRLVMHQQQLQTQERLIHKIDDGMKDLNKTQMKILIELQRKQDYYPKKQ